MRKVYMDNSSTSFPKAPGLGEAMGEFINRSGCNVGRGGYEMAYEVGVKVLETRELISDLFGLKNAENVVFTSNVTAGINYVVQGLLHDGDHVIISAMECNRNKTLTILCIPNNDKRIKQAIVDRLGCVSVIEIKGDLADEHRAKEYLQYKCDNAAIEPNEKLFAEVTKKGKSFNSSELDVIFDKWFDNNLRTVVYPQYSMFESVNFGNVKDEPKGNYYTELNNMIGLRKVKKQ